MKILRLFMMVVVVLVAFAGGVIWKSWFDARERQDPQKTGQRKILHWVDPMHPAYTSDKPGIAPDCGMKLVPVYEDGSQGETAVSEKPTGKVLYYTDPQQPA
jgi:Cu(I)/Ag(I) efflux system membrane fusion protein